MTDTGTDEAATTEVEGAAAPLGAWRRMRLWGTAHAVDDLYQGLIPAGVPYFVLDRHYGYVAASGLTLAATIGSSVPQPFIGLAVDRLRLGRLAGHRHRARRDSASGCPGCSAPMPRSGARSCSPASASPCSTPRPARPPGRRPGTAPAR